ncbi:bifunctional 2-polyprenyl-6-hydroxyphenol methylase/3-demethylubiquinol 3-O-methyltransferase UbiG [Synechococcus sp. MU1617]|uniref:class I SAM-dependent methyltransferase n=1 Tax=Synechococcus sp. MU1617 TaxID=2508346 RepID=UPI001CF7ED26|nr:class I SAM-dependent methyltransferase [Synechococcus sp. MU1617]MCB4389465.1 class I SAM-dependent methyltransferase [Synechococcus sp. MU1617]
MKQVSYTKRYEELYQKGYQINKYPYDLVVSNVLKNFPKEDPTYRYKALDLGCGVGNHVKFLAMEGFDVWGVDSSPTALKIAKNMLDEANLTAQLIEDNLLNIDNYPNKYDLILDRQSLSNLTCKDIQIVIDKAITMLNPGGKFISFMFNKEHPGFSELKYAKEIEKDTWSFESEYKSSCFSNINQITLIDLDTYKSFFHRLEPLSIINNSQKCIVSKEGISEYVGVFRKP